MQKNTLISNYSMLLAIGLIWGSQFMFNALSLETLSPDAVATGRIVIGALTMVLLLFFFKKGDKKPEGISTTTLYLKYFLIAVFEAVLPFVSIAWGLQYVDSSVAAIIIGTVPIFTAFISSVFFRQGRLRLQMVVSLIVGFLGLCVLILPTVGLNQFQHTVGEIVILFGALSFALAMVLIKTMPEMSTIRLTRNVYLIAAVLMSLLLIVKGQPIHLSAISLSSIMAITVLGVFCSGIVYLLFVKLIMQATPTFASLSNYLVPLFGAIFGTLLMGDKLHNTTIYALLLIFLSLLISNFSELRLLLQNVLKRSGQTS